MSENMELWHATREESGFVCHPYVHIIFQRGPTSIEGVNGCTIEEVIEAAQNRLLEHQANVLACDENAEALRHLEAAREALSRRRTRRQREGVLGTAAPHGISIS